ncbi:MAG: ATP-dependent Clp protease adaptor ClpS [Planctomycetes bacterium]|nr:ATP-dependent Clp protease adaptor ClpS [Planctomycetota bacterium]MCW8138441.1 ATP-dependent Clp protease adaptor ClpS [Planctomycetota bacterium]
MSEGGGVETEEQVDTRTRTIPPYNVVLLDDDDHTYEYVIEMLRAVFGMSQEKAYLHACEVDSLKRTILLTTSREHAELKCEQVHAFGPDPRIPRCKGSMTAIIEPA